MGKLVITQSYHYPAVKVFSELDHINKLARIKSDLRNYRIARDEEGLQLIDVDIRFLLKRFPLRLMYTSVPQKYCELKMLRGSLKQYEYRYTVAGDNVSTTVTVECSVKLPFKYLLISPLIKALIKLRIKKEFALLKKILQTKL